MEPKANKAFASNTVPFLMYHCNPGTFGGIIDFERNFPIAMVSNPKKALVEISAWAVSVNE